MKIVFQQKVQEKEQKLKQSEEELYARHREMKDALEKQKQELEDKRRKIESGRPLTPEKGSVSQFGSEKKRNQADLRIVDPAKEAIWSRQISYPFFNLVLPIYDLVYVSTSCT